MPSKDEELWAALCAARPRRITCRSSARARRTAPGSRSASATSSRPPSTRPRPCFPAQRSRSSTSTSGLSRIAPRTSRAWSSSSRRPGYLAGYLAGLWAARRGGKAVGSIGGLDIPPVDRALAGFRFGAKRATPGLTVLNAYSGDFAVPSNCQKQALEQIAKGLRRRVPGCRALRCRGTLRGSSEGHLRDRLRRRPVLVRHDHPDQRARASRRRRRGRGARRALGAVGRRHQRDLRGQERGHHGRTTGAPGWASRSAGRWRASSRS